MPFLVQSLFTQSLRTRFAGSLDAAFIAAGKSSRDLLANLLEELRSSVLYVWRILPQRPIVKTWIWAHKPYTKKMAFSLHSLHSILTFSTDSSIIKTEQGKPIDG